MRQGIFCYNHLTSYPQLIILIKEEAAVKKTACFVVFIYAMIVALCSCAYGGVKLNEANFPDPVLREWLQNLAWFDGWKQVPITDRDGNVTGYRWEWKEEYKDGELSDYELNHKDYIGIDNSNLADLTGIEKLPNLKRMYLTNCQIVNANISGMSKLTEFHCTGPNLVSINASGCSSLVTLGCAHDDKSGQIEKINVSGCSSLQTIYCNGNKLTSLNLSGLTSLRTLSAADNQFKKLNLSPCTSLTNVCLDNSPLEELNVSGCTNLRELWTLRTNLRKLDISGCTALTRLGCFDNKLEELDLSHNTNLYELHCERNRLKELDLSKNTSLSASNVACGGQESEGLKVKVVDGGYEVDLKALVSKVENIDVSSLRANGGSSRFLSYDGVKGVAVFEECPKTLRYNYKTQSKGNALMDVSVKSSLNVAVIERGAPLETIICDMTDKNYLDTYGNPITEATIAGLSEKVYGKKGFVADGNSRLIVRVQTLRPGSVTFTLKDNIEARVERLTDRADITGTNYYISTTEISEGNYQASAVLIAPEQFPSKKKFPADKFGVHVKFTAEYTGEEIPEDEKVMEEDLTLEIRAAPVVLVHSFGKKASVEDSFSKNGKGILPSLEKAGFNIYTCNYGGLNAPSSIATKDNNTLFNQIIIAFEELRREGIICTKADIVAYGTGGLLARRFCVPDNKPNDGNYYTFRAYKQGIVRRLITVATPHEGTPWGNFMLGDYSALNKDAPLFELLGTRLVCGIVLKGTFRYMLGAGFWSGKDSAELWRDISVGSTLVNNSYPVNVPMYTIYGDVRKFIDAIIAGIDTASAVWGLGDFKKNPKEAVQSAVKKIQNIEKGFKLIAEGEIKSAEDFAYFLLSLDDESFNAVGEATDFVADSAIKVASVPSSPAWSK
ncbi:MAG: hypothetical protein IJQ58_05610, partial [Synergistaceae bacterium]|nr:hypothetical protein [Synergistaceae bacterium]